MTEKRQPIMFRRGYSLIEMLVVITVGSVIMGVGAGVLPVLMHAEQTGRDRAAEARILARLAEQFRSNVAAAVRQTTGAGQGERRFVMAGDRLTTYRVLPGEVRRNERVAGKPVRHESYVLPSGWSAAITVQGEPAPAVMRLVVADDVFAGNGAPPAAGREIRVAAALGKDHRFTKSPVGSQ